MTTSTRRPQVVPKVDVPEGTSGPWAVERFTVDPTRSVISLFSYGGRAPTPGDYTRLMRNGSVWMSDTNAERRDHYGFARAAQGRVLIAGLGLGVCVQAALQKERVDHVTVVEIDQHVIDLVAPHYLERFGDRLTISHGDIFDHPSSSEEWDTAWFDIWRDLCTDNLTEYGKLKRRYPPRRIGWRGFWCEDLLRYYKRQGR